MHCPNCRGELRKLFIDQGIVYQCTACAGINMGLSVLKKFYCSRELVNQLWQESRHQSRSGDRPCPHCDKQMNLVRVRLGEQDLDLDVCKICQQIWFDPQEFEKFPKDAPPKPVKEELPDKCKQAMAEIEMRKAETSIRRSFEESNDSPSAWQWIPGLLGLPAEIDGKSVNRVPFITWGLGIILIGVFVAEVYLGLDKTIREYGYVPTLWNRHYGLTVLTSFLLHGGIFHLLSNLYFLLVFGDNVEDRLGHTKYLGLILVSDLVGTLFYTIFNAQSSIPCVGASGGICGVITYYAIMFPNNRIGFLVRGGFVYGWVKFPAWVGCLIFIGLQLVGIYLTRNHGDSGGIAYLAHLGGAVIGVGVAILDRLFTRDETLKEYRYHELA